MPRKNHYRPTENLENLEGRSLQSGLVLGDTPVAAPQSAVITTNTPLSAPNISLHGYHTVTGFYGQ